MYPAQFDLTPEQALFQETSRKFLEKESPLHAVRALIEDPRAFDAELWQRQAELGWFGLLVPEEFGGGSLSDTGVIDLILVAGEIGRLVQPGPILPTNIVADAINRSGSGAQRQELLPRIAAGELVATWCFGEPDVLWGGRSALVRATPHGDDFVLEGKSVYVQDAQSADHLLVTAAGSGGLSQFVMPVATPGVRIEARQCLDLARRIDDVHFDGVVVAAASVLGEVGAARPDVERQFDLAVALQTAESVGAVDRVFEFTLEYSKDRVAFGRPIGSFQAIKHRLADMVTSVESCKATADAAARAVAEGSERAAELVSIAKAYVGQTAPTIIQECVQIHGGIGVTWDHDLHLYLRRVATNAALYGTPSSLRERLVTLLED